MLPLEQYAALENQAGLVHGFVRRVPGIDVAHEKAEVLRRLDHVHREARAALGLGGVPFLTAEQVHGNEIAVIDQPLAADRCFARCDGLVTNQAGLALGIHVADCCAVYLFDPRQRVIGLVHSGKKGTELQIAVRAVDAMEDRFGSRAAEIIAQLSPCIRPPHYEIDFAAAIRDSLRDRGVAEVHDNGVCTACDLEKYYSYRAEKGRTGRMLALCALV